MADHPKPSATEAAAAMIEKAAAEDRARREPFVMDARSLGERRDDLMLKWRLSLAVGNGAGGVGLTSAIVNTWTKATPQVPFVAGLWCFAFGLFAAGLIPLLGARKLNRDREHRLVSVYEFVHGGTSVVYVSDDDVELSEDVRARHWKAGERWNWAVVAAQAVSAAAFVAGVLVPLIWLTFHLRK